MSAARRLLLEPLGYQCDHIKADSVLITQQYLLYTIQLGSHYFPRDGTSTEVTYTEAKNFSSAYNSSPFSSHLLKRKSVNSRPTGRKRSTQVRYYYMFYGVLLRQRVNPEIAVVSILTVFSDKLSVPPKSPPLHIFPFGPLLPATRNNGTIRTASLHEKRKSSQSSLLKNSYLFHLLGRSKEAHGLC